MVKYLLLAVLSFSSCAKRNLLKEEYVDTKTYVNLYKEGEPAWLSGRDLSLIIELMDGFKKADASRSSEGLSFISAHFDKDGNLIVLCISDAAMYVVYVVDYQSLKPLKMIFVFNEK